MKRVAGWLLLCVLTVSLFGAGTAGGSEPSQGVIGPAEQGAQTSVGWRGPPPPGGVSGPLVRGCEQPGIPLYCDYFDLEVAVPPGYWTEKTGGVEIEIAWPDPADQYRVCNANTNTCKSSRDVASTGHRFGSIRMFVERPSGPLRLRVQYDQVVDDRDGYTGVARFVSSSTATPAIFDQQSALGFGPATIVSAHFLGPEPQVSVERPAEGQAEPGPLDRDRMFVDWPMGLTSTSSQLHRSEDGGESFRLLFDMECPERNRPGCATAGGGDSDTAVNPVNGNVYFTDLEAGNVAFATSNNHGDDFPVDQQRAISNPVIPPDRQWVAAVDPRTFQLPAPGTGSATPLQAFLAYENGQVSKVIQGIDLAGNPIPQPAPQIPNFSAEKGPLLADTSRGPGGGWLYLGGGDRVATVHASNYQKPEGTEDGWRVHRVMPIPHNGVDVFQWLALDEAGNAYAVWVPSQPGGSSDPAVVMFSASPIDEPANDPRDGGWPGSYWTEPIQVSLPGLGSVIFPSVTAGSEGRVGLAYMGTDDHVGSAGTAPAGAEWNTYGAVITNALEEGARVVRTGEVSERIAHLGPICTFGVACDVESGDRSLLDLIDVSFDADGRLTVVSMDNHSSFAERNAGIPIAGEKKHPFAHVSKQVAGPSLFPGADLAIPVASSPTSDPAGDATWPNIAAGTNLQALDLRAASLELEGADIVARIALADASSETMTRDLGTYAASYPVAAPRAERLQYILRFSTEHDIYHLSFEHQMGGARRGFGGRLDDNDRLLAHSRPAAPTNGAGYHTDDVKVEARIEDNTLVLTIPATVLGLGEGTRLFSVTAFAAAGPLEENEKTTENIMRTVDASAPFDTTLGLKPTSPPTPTAAPTSIPCPSGSASASPTPTGEPTSTPTPEAGGSPTPCPSPSPSPTPSPSPSPTPTPTPAPGGRCDIVGTPGDDRLRGTAAGETICGLGGDDVLIGAGGADTLLGGKGNDRLLGQAGPDILDGRQGRDELRGGTGRDLLFGRRDNDDLYGGRDDDSLRGGRGWDRCRGGSGDDRRRNCERR